MMKQRLQVLAFLSVGFATANAQTAFWSDDFEDVGAPSAGTRVTSIAEFTCNTPATYYFTRTNAAGIYPSVANPGNAYSNVQGSKLFAAMDIDRGPGCFNGNGQISAGQTITWTGINIAGKTGMSFKGLFGANTNGIFQGTAFPGALDSMVIEYRINGVGAWNKIIGIFCNNATTTGGPLAVDNNNDRVGDGSVLTLALTEITGNITGVGSTMDLRFSIFNNNTGEGSMAIDNFRLFDGTALSVTLASFGATKNKGTASLSWATATESESLGFDVQRSMDGQTYQDIGFVPTKAANGSSQHMLSYTFQDNAPATGVNLYRLAEKNKQGSITYSDVRSLHFDKIEAINCYPNPVHTQLTVDYVSEKQEQVHVKVTDVMGKHVLYQNVAVQKGRNQFHLDLSALSRGMFHLNIDNEAGKVFSTRVAKH